MTDLTRRAFLAGAASLPVVAAIGPAVAAEAPIVAPLAAYVDPLGASAALPVAPVRPTMLLPDMWASACWHFGEAQVRRMGYAPHQFIPVTSVGYTNADGEWIEWI